jgi:hypothetical protein
VANIVISDVEYSGSANKEIICQVHGKESDCDLFRDSIPAWLKGPRESKKASEKTAERQSIFLRAEALELN